jgi:hypothetical protein
VAPAGHGPESDTAATASVRNAGPAGVEEHTPQDQQPAAVPGGSATVMTAAGERYPRPRSALALLLVLGRV